MSGPGNGASDSKWDIRHGQSWSAVVGNIMYEGICSNSNYTATGEDSCVGNGACLPSNTHSGYNNDEAACIAAGGTWSSSNYTWTPGQWTGTQNSSADLDNVEMVYFGKITSDDKQLIFFSINSEEKILTVFNLQEIKDNKRFA